MPCHLAKQIYRNTPTFERLKNYNEEEDGDGDADDDHWPGPGNPFAGGGDLRHGDDEEDGGLSGGVQWHHNHPVITITIILATRWPLSPICNPVWEQRAQSTTWSTRSIQSCKWLSLALTLESSASSLSPKEALAKIIMIILRIKVMMGMLTPFLSRGTRRAWDRSRRRLNRWGTVTSRRGKISTRSSEIFLREV